MNSNSENVIRRNGERHTGSPINRISNAEQDAPYAIAAPQQLPLYTTIPSQCKRGAIRPVWHHQRNYVVWEMRLDGQVLIHESSYPNAARFMWERHGLRFPAFSGDDDNSDRECPDNLPLENEVVTVDLEPVEAARATTLDRRTQSKAEKRCYALARQHGLDINAAAAMRDAFVKAYGRKIKSRSEITEAEWERFARDVELGTWVGDWCQVLFKERKVAA